MQNIRTGDIELIKELNENLVFRSLMRRQPISRVGLSKATRLSLSTVTKIINQFEERELILEDSVGQSSGGRRPTLLRVNSEGGYVVGINFDIVGTTIALLDLQGNIKKMVKIPTEIEGKGGEEVLQTIAEMVKKLVDDFESETGFKQKMLGVGIAVLGGVDRKTGMLMESANLGWRNVPIVPIVRRITGVQTFIEDVPKAMAIGEHWFGDANDTDSLVCVYIGGGLGIGVVINGSVYRGVTGNPGEFCHVSVVKNGPQCKCGNRGCLETFVGEVPVLRRVKEAIEMGTKTQIGDMIRGGNCLKMSHVFQAAKQGDSFAGNIVDEMVHYTSLAVSIAMTAYDPMVVVVGGPVINEGEGEFFERIKAETQAKMIKDGRELQRGIRLSALGDDALVISAAALVYEELFKISLVTQ
jgi:predicted NBD/HSP70 family sugar kinase